MMAKIDHRELKEYIRLMRKFEKKANKFSKKADRLLAKCKQSECSQCGRIVCVFKDPMHFHHDGCPSCF